MQAVERRIAHPQLLHQPSPLVFKLPFGHWNPPRNAGLPELRAVEVIGARERLGMDTAEIDIDRSARSAAGAEALELGVMAIADGAPVKDMPREERFTPERHQALRIQVLRVQRPEPQTFSCRNCSTSTSSRRRAAPG